jgi:hypothetical protein
MKHVARKRFGQNFLHDQHVLDRITDSIAPAAGDTMVEIGPGLGAMTDQLRAACRTCMWWNWTATWWRAWKSLSSGKADRTRAMR